LPCSIPYEFRWGGQRSCKKFLGLSAGIDEGEKFNMEYKNGIRHGKHEICAEIGN
jgi:hypothetical protein